MPDSHVNQLIGHLFRHEAGKMASVLTRLLGFQRLELAEDIVQDTLLKALSSWKYKGVPDNPQAWLYKVAKRKAIDVLRQNQIHEEHHTEISYALKSEWTLSPTVNSFFLENEIEDSQLRMMFACCHPLIPYDSQIALTLKTLCGLSILEISNSFLTNEETIVKRLYRAREKIREESISLDGPLPTHLPGRLDAVLDTLYLLFNEGYNSSHPDQLIRHDLCQEAMRLCLLLTRNKLTETPRTLALLALMCFQASRAEARLRADGSIVLLRDQDRSRWNTALIDNGKYFLEKSANDDVFTDYHVEAAIAGCHAAASSFNTTEWTAIIDLYTVLDQMKPSPIVKLNRAIAIGYGMSAAAGIEALNTITSLQGHYLYHAALGDFQVAVGDLQAATTSYEHAIELTQSKPERQLLSEKISKLQH